MFIGFPGELFLRMLMLVVLPFIVSSVITSVTTLNKSSAAKLGKRAGVYYFANMLIAVAMAVVLATVIIKPREAHKIEKQETMMKTGLSPKYAILDLLRNMVPDNIVETSISSTRTKLKKKVKDFKFVNESTVGIKSSARNLSSFLKKEVINPWSVSTNSVQVIKEENVIDEYAGQEKFSSVNLLGALVLSILFGIILNGLGEEGKPVADWFRCLFQVIMKIVNIFLWFSPVGVGSIIAGNLVAMHDIKGIMENLGLYILTVVIAAICHGVIILPIIYAILLRRNPFRLMSCVAKALVTGFGTASSAVTIPVTLTSLKEKKMVDGCLAQFMLPIGSIINAPGTAIYIAVSAIFIVQTFHSSLLDFNSSILIWISSVIATLAAPPIAGIIPLAMRAIVLQVIGIPTTDIGLVLGVDWLVDRCVTPVNIFSNCVGCVIVEHYSHNELQSWDNVTKPRNDPETAVADDKNTVTIDIPDEGEETKESNFKDLPS